MSQGRTSQAAAEKIQAIYRGRMVREQQAGDLDPKDGWERWKQRWHIGDDGDGSRLNVVKRC